MTIKRASITDARANFSELVGRAQYGDEPTVITHHDKPVAVLVPFEEGSEIAKALALKLTVDNINHIRERYGSESTARAAADLRGNAMALLNNVGVASQQQMAEQAQEVEERQLIRLPHETPAEKPEAEPETWVSGGFVSRSTSKELRKLAAKLLKKHDGDIPAAKLAYDEIVKAEYPRVLCTDSDWEDAERQFRLGLE